MRRSIGMFVALVSAGTVVAALAIPGVSLASDEVLPGYDLFETLEGTTFAGQSFVGVPLGTFDFGVPIGAQNIGNTDTIVQRLISATAASPSIPIEMLALQLESAAPVNFGLGLDFYFITLQSVRGGPATSGRMTINFGPEGTPHGTFSSFFDVFFDVRKGALNGPIALSDDLLLTSQGVPWAHDPAPDELIIDGVNHFLNGTDITNDFQPIGDFQEVHPTGAIHAVRTTRNSVPEPGSLALLGAVALAVLGTACLRRLPTVT